MKLEQIRFFICGDVCVYEDDGVSDEYRDLFIGNLCNCPDSLLRRKVFAIGSFDNRVMIHVK